MHFPCSPSYQLVPEAERRLLPGYAQFLSAWPNTDVPSRTFLATATRPFGGEGIEAPTCGLDSESGFIRKKSWFAVTCPLAQTPLYVRPLRARRSGISTASVSQTIDFAGVHV
jgi:hypothetical protein